MASGNINVTTSNQYISGNCSWSSVPNTAGNYSDVTATVRVSRTNTGYTTYGTGTWYLTINGVQNQVTKVVEITYQSNTLLISNTVRVYHDADGSKSISISCTGGIPNTSYYATYCSGTAVLDTIPRASQPTLSSGTVELGTSFTVYTNRLSSSFLHTIRYEFIGASGTIATDVPNSVVSIPSLNLANQIPASTSGVGTIYCDTYDGVTFIGTKSVPITFTVPASIVPTYTDITATELNTNVSTIVGKFVQNLSNIRFSINGASGAYSSTITQYKINYNGVDYVSSATHDTGIVTISGSPTVTGTITDSRGRTAVDTVIPEILSYSPPTIDTFTVVRSDNVGNPTELGTYAKIVREGHAQSLINTTERNTVACKVYQKLRTSSTWVEIPSAEVTQSSNVAGAVDNTPIVVSGFPITSAYDFKMELVDQFNTTISTVVLAVGATVMSWSEDGVGIGKVWQSGALDVGGNSNFDGNVDVTGNLDFDGTMNGYDFEGSSGNRHGIIPVVKTDGVMEVGEYIDMHQTDGDTSDYDVRLQAWSDTLWIYGDDVNINDDPIVEYGENANGRWIRYYNGIQICTVNTSITISIANAYGGLYQNTWIWNYPATFISAPAVSCSHFKWGTGASWGTVSASNAGTANLRVIDDFSRDTSSTSAVGAIAIGRWK